MTDNAQGSVAHFGEPVVSSHRSLDPNRPTRPTIQPVERMLQSSPTQVSPRTSRGPSASRLLQLLLAVLLLGTSLTSLAQVAGSMDIWPRDNTAEPGATKQFGAYVPINPNTVEWLVNDIVGGNASIGTISPSGLYTAPAVIPAANVLTIKARSTAFPAQFASTSLTLIRKYPWLWGVSPSPLLVGNYQVSFNGANFAPDSQALANGQPVATTFVSSTKLVITGTAAATGTIQFAVRQPGNGSVTGNSVNVTVNAAPITVAVSPSSATVPLATSTTFAATVSGSANTAVTWTVNGIAGGSSAVGTISAAGLYTAPAVMPASSTVTVRATSVANTSSFAQATITLIQPPPPVSITVSPATATLLLGASQAFSSTVTGSANTSVTWSVNGINGGSSTVGTISSAGLYTAPAAMPASSTVTVRATSVVNPAASAQSTVTLAAPPPVTVAVSPATVTTPVGTTQLFVATVTGSVNTAVTWSVNGTAGGSATVGTISSAGLYTAPAAVPATPTVSVRATSVANPNVFAQAALTITPPPPPSISLANARFLEQTSFGPSPAALARVAQLGFSAYLDEQMALPETPIPTPSDNSMGTLRQWALYNYGAADDQLRQRVAYSLGQILVTSGNKLIYADEILPWMRLLSKHAFGNYRDLLRDITISPSMGKYLDLANSMKPGLAGGANENYARELMQLFTIGLWELNDDGSLVIDGNGFAVPAYNQGTVAQVALALTGWTYATAPGATPQNNNWEYFGAPMETRQQNHDTSAKSFLGCTVPANQTVQQDLDSLLDCLMNHPNTAPFISLRLIRSLVTSNPSPGYVQRVAHVFANNGAGVRGDLNAVVRAIVLDPEARQDIPTVNQGRLKEPILQITGLLRALNGGFTPNHGLAYLFDYMSQSILAPPSVFNWFSPLYRVPKSPLFGPEFQIYTQTDAALRGNFLYLVLSNSGADTVVDLSPFQAYGNDMPNLVEAVNQRLLYGRMPPAMKQALITAATPGYDAKTRIETVLYLTVLSGQHAVQY